MERFYKTFKHPLDVLFLERNNIDDAIMAVMKDVRGTSSATGDTSLKSFFGREMNHKLFWLSSRNCVSGQKRNYEKEIFRSELGFW